MVANRARRRVAAAEQFTGWAFVTPGVAIIVLFGAVPIIWSAVMSFQRNNLLTADTPFVGLKNYRQMVHDPVVAQAIEHTLIYTALFVPGTMIVGLFLAVAMNRKIRFISLYRTAAYATMAISTISEAIVFIWLFDPSYGIANYVLGKVGIPQQQFLNSPSEALYVIVLMTIWGWTGFAVVIYLAALQGVPQNLLEAAAIDGAGPWRTFRRVTFPLLSPATLFLAVWLTINALQLFDEVYLSTQGGPLNATTVLVYYLYNQAFGQFNFGYASAIAYFLFLVIIVVTVIQFRAGRRFTYYRSLTAIRSRLLFSPWHLVLVPATLVLIFPFIWLLVTSVETPSEALRFPPVLTPHVVRLANYPDALHSAPFGRFFLNSAVVALVTVLSNLVLCSLAGYAFARFRFLGRGVLFAVIMATLMVPFQVTMIPQFIITKWLGVHVLAAVGINHLGALIAPNAATAFGIFFLRQFFRTLPLEYEESARVDGASRLTVLLRIVLPLAVPALSTLAALTFLDSWNNFLWPLIAITSTKQMTLPLGLATFQGAHATEWTLLMAANVMSLAPMLVIFFLAQRHFVRSVAATGLAGT